MEKLRQNTDTLSRSLRRDFEGIIAREEIKDASIEAKKSYLIKAFRDKRDASILKDVPDEVFHGLIDQLEVLTVSSEEDLIDQVLGVALSFVANVFPDTAALEENLRSNLMKTRGWTELNKVLAYEVKENRAEIHVPMVLTEGPLQLKKLVIEGLQKLAHSIKTDRSFDHVAEIEGVSWIVFKHPRLVESLGFTIESQNDGVGVATMSRQKLLEIYG